MNASWNLHPVHIRATHPSGFRSGEWAIVVGVEWVRNRHCYRVRFLDGKEDSWPIDDTMDPYEFRDGDPTEIREYA